MEVSTTGQARHGSATTTHAVRAAIQRLQASLAPLTLELGINRKTVAKWRKQATVEDMKTGPTESRSTALTEAEEAIGRGLQKAQPLPIRRLPLCIAAVDPAPDALSVAFNAIGFPAA